MKINKEIYKSEWSIFGVCFLGLIILLAIAQGNYDIFLGGFLAVVFGVLVYLMSPVLFIFATFLVALLMLQEYVFGYFIGWFIVIMMIILTIDNNRQFEKLKDSHKNKYTNIKKKKKNLLVDKYPIF